jgi:hypothetical protein
MTQTSEVAMMRLKSGMKTKRLLSIATPDARHFQERGVSATMMYRISLYLYASDNYNKKYKFDEHVWPLRTPAMTGFS